MTTIELAGWILLVLFVGIGLVAVSACVLSSRISRDEERHEFERRGYGDGM